MGDWENIGVCYPDDPVTRCGPGTQIQGRKCLRSNEGCPKTTSLECGSRSRLSCSKLLRAVECEVPCAGEDECAYYLVVFSCGIILWYYLVALSCGIILCQNLSII